MIENHISCMLCGSLAEKKHERYPGFQEPSFFEIFHCTGCLAAFSIPRNYDTKELYDNIYNNGASVPGYARYWKYAEGVKRFKNPLNYLSNAENVFWGINSALRKIISDKKSTRILEVGSGLGYLTYALSKDGYNTVGLDISATAVEKAIQNYGNYYICGDIYSYSTRDELYDVVILTEVIEHINEPIRFLESIVKLLKPKGYILLSTPNKNIFPPDVVWATDNPPIHCWWFSEESIKYLGKTIDSMVEFIDFTIFHEKHFVYLMDNPDPTLPILDQNGQVIFKSPVKKSTSWFRQISRFIIERIYYLRKAYVILKHRNNQHFFICKSRAPVLCAIMQKNN